MGDREEAFVDGEIVCEHEKRRHCLRVLLVCVIVCTDEVAAVEKEIRAAQHFPVSF